MRTKAIVGIVLCIFLVLGIALAAKNSIQSMLLKDAPADVQEDIANKMSMTPQEVLFTRIEQLRQQHQEKENEETAGDETS